MLLSRIFLTVLCATSLTACLEESKTSDPIVIGDIACGPQHATTFSANIQSSDIVCKSLACDTTYKAQSS
jgi:hypothetical protein